MDDADPEDFNMEKLVNYLHYKAKFMPPADNPRQAVSQARQNRRQRLDNEHTMKNINHRLPPLRQHIYNTNRS